MTTVMNVSVREGGEGGRGFDELEVTLMIPGDRKRDETKERESQPALAIAESKTWLRFHAVVRTATANDRNTPHNNASLTLA